MRNIKPLVDNHRVAGDIDGCDICEASAPRLELHQTLNDFVVCGACGSALHDIHVANYWSPRVIYAVRYFKCYAKNRLPRRILTQLHALLDEEH